MSIDLFVCALDNRPLLEHDDNPIDSREPDPWNFPGCLGLRRARSLIPVIRFGSSVRDELGCLLLKRFCFGRWLSRLVTRVSRSGQDVVSYLPSMHLEPRGRVFLSTILRLSIDGFLCLIV